MKQYRGKYLAAAVLCAALPLFGCGDADTWKETTDIVLSAPAPEGLNEVIFTVKSRPPAEGEGYACDTLLQYRAEGAGVNIIWASVPGTETTRVFAVRPRAEGIMSVIARGKCDDAKEDWKYSNQVDVTFTELALPTVTSVTLTANPATVVKNNPVTFTLGATKAEDCTLRLKYQYSGAGFGVTTVDPAATGQFILTPTSVGTLTVSATAWCAENPSAQSVTTVAVAVTDMAAETITTPGIPTGLGALAVTPGPATASYNISTSSVSSYGDLIEYSFDWGDGSAANWSGVLPRSHTWLVSGTYAVTVQARCATHPTITSAPSAAKTVTVGP